MWSGDTPRGPEVVGEPSRRYGSGRGNLPKVRKWSENPPRGLEVVWSPTRRSGSGRKLSRRFKRGRETLGGSEVVGTSSRRSGTGREVLPQCRVR